MNFDKILRIIGFEIDTSIRQRNFWIAPIIIPVLATAGLFASRLLFSSHQSSSLPRTAAAAISSPKDSAPAGSGERHVALFDGTDSFYHTGAMCDPTRHTPEGRVARLIRGASYGKLPPTVCYKTLAEALSAVKDNKARAAFEIPENFLSTGNYNVYAGSGGESSALLGYLFDSYYRQLLIESSTMPQNLKNRLRSSFTTREFVLKNGEFSPQQRERQAQFNYAAAVRGFGKPIIALIGVFLVITSFGVGINCTQIERGSHLIEVILSSVTAKEYVLGKVIALTLLNTFQVGLTTILAAVPSLYIFRSELVLALPHVPIPDAWTTVLTLAILMMGSFFASAAGAGFGVLSTPESSARSGRPIYMSFITYVALYAGVALSFSDNPFLQQILSFAPPFSLFLMPQRLLFNEVSWIEGFAAFLLLTLATIAMAAISARILRLCLNLDSIWVLLRKCLSPFRTRRVSA